MKTTSLADFNNSWYRSRSLTVKILWYAVNIIFFKASIPYPSGFKRNFLRLFGADVGKRVVIKPSVSIKYPWLLSIGDYTWIGERVVIDNLGFVLIEDNVCISQGAYLVSGSHDYRDPHFGLITREIKIKAGSWVGCQAILCPGAVMGHQSCLTAGSVLTGNLPANEIWQGNPAIYKRLRYLE